MQPFLEYEEQDYFFGFSHGPQSVIPYLVDKLSLNFGFDSRRYQHN
jgi:hypothetical protein